MTVVSETGQKIPLGVGKILGDSFSILFGNFFKVLVLGFVGVFIGFVIDGFLIGFDAAAGLSDPSFTEPGSALGQLLSMLNNAVVYGLITALVVQLAYDAKLGRTNSFGTYFSSAIPALVPIVVLNVVISILVSIGFLALIIGAVWVSAVFCVTVPAAVIERAGFNAMGRSAALTKEYRWPIAGTLLVIAIIIILLALVTGVVAVLVAVMLASGGGAAILAGVVFSLIVGLGYGYGGIAAALIYARLREIKEGVDVDQIAAVFD